MPTEYGFDLNTTVNLSSERTYLRFWTYFFALLTIGCVVRDIDTQPHLFSTISSFSQHLPLDVSDPRSFSIGALDVFHHGWVTSENTWIIHLWPPGFILLEAAVLKVFGENAQFVFVLIVLSALLGACMLNVISGYLRPRVGPMAAALLPLVPFCFPVTRMFLLEPIGVVLGEGFAVMFFITAGVILLEATERSALGLAILSGVLLALAAYFRSQYELLLLVLTLGAVPFIGGLVMSRRRDITAGYCNRGAPAGPVIIVALLVAHLIMVPWRIHNIVDANSASWVQTSHLVMLNSLSSDRALLARKGEFVIEGAGNLACALEPPYCDKTDVHLYYKAFFDHFGEWYKRKLSVIGRYWFASLSNFGMITHPATHMDVAINVFLLLCVLATVPLLFLIRSTYTWPVLVWLIASFYSAFFVIFTLVQFETRYFYLIKIFAVVTTIVLSSMIWKGRSLAHDPTRREPDI